MRCGADPEAETACYSQPPPGGPPPGPALIRYLVIVIIIIVVINIIIITIIIFLLALLAALQMPALMRKITMMTMPNYCLLCRLYFFSINIRKLLIHL